MKRMLRFIQSRRHWLVPLGVFLAVYTLHFWATFQSGVLYGGPGDHIAGIIWLFDQYPQSPWWQFTGHAAYPWGDNLWSPLFATGQIGYILYWIFARITDSSVIGYNVFTALGFAASFTVSYVFLYRRIFQRTLLSSLFAATITFSPLILLLNGVGHTSYIFMPVYFVSTVWLILRIFEAYDWHLAVLLGLLLGSTIVFDPYFVLFVPMAAAAFALTLFTARYGVREKLVQSLGICVIAASLIVAPVILYIKQNASAIDATSSVTRTAMLHDAYSYSARLSDYVLPAQENPFVPQSLRQIKQESYHGKDRTFTLFLGYVVLIALAVVTVGFLRYRPQSAIDRKQRKVALALSIVALVAFIFSLPPTMEFFGITLKMPTWYLVHVTSAWRVFARLYVILQPAIVLIIAFGAALWLRTADPTSRQRFIRSFVIVLACLLVIFIEYLPRNPFDSSKFWSFDKNLPSVYSRLADHKDLQILAEYPLREQPYYQGSMYLAGQHVHKKTTFNAYSPISSSTYQRQSLVDLNGAQTIPVLRFLGVDSLIVWNTKAQTWQAPQGVSQISGESYKSMFGLHKPVLFKVDTQGDTNRYMVVLRQDFRPGDDKQIYDLPIPVSNGMAFELRDLCKDVPEAKRCSQEGADRLRFSSTVINQSNKPVDMAIKKNEKTVFAVTILPGNNTITTTLSQGEYTLQYDQSASGAVSLQNFQASK